MGLSLPLVSRVQMRALVVSMKPSGRIGSAAIHCTAQLQFDGLGVTAAHRAPEKVFALLDMHENLDAVLPMMYEAFEGMGFAPFASCESRVHSCRWFLLQNPMLYVLGS